MSHILKGNMLIAQSGGPTAVINQSLVGAVLQAKKHKEIKGIYGSLHGIKGILAEDFVNLRKETVANLKSVAVTPSSGLGTVRKKPTPEDCECMFEIMLKYNIRYFFYIGGNDSAETTHIINEEAKRVDYEFRCFHIPKTIDNDLRENDHTPGFGSAAKFVACAVMGDNLDNRALPGVKIDVVMGRHAGFLAASSALARQYPDDGPHLIYVPERKFIMHNFIEDVKRVYDRLGRCVIVVSEGISDEDGTPVASRFISEVDSHGNVQLSGSGMLGDVLAHEVRNKTKVSRVRADTFGYLQRSFPNVYSEVDAAEARRAGEKAVECAASGDLDGSIALRRKSKKSYSISYDRVELKLVARETRHMPANFINKAGNDVTPSFMQYVRPIVGELPSIGKLKGVQVPKVH